MKAHEIVITEAQSLFRELKDVIGNSNALIAVRASTKASLIARVKFIDDVEMTVANRYYRKKLIMGIKLTDSLSDRELIGIDKYDESDYLPILEKQAEPVF